MVTPDAESPSYATFEETPFGAPIKAELNSAYSAPSAIQSLAWPIAVTGSDLIAVAKTGSGKTLGFVLPILHRLPAPAGQGSIGALVLSPTRELASQIHVEAARFGALVKQSTMVVYGGTPLHEQKAALAARRPSLLVATPGRLVDLLSSKAIELTHCAMAVLDEADRLLDMGFAPQLNATFAALPTDRQTLLFTATWPKAVRKLASTYLRDGDATKRLFLGGSDGATDGTDDSAHGSTQAGSAAEDAAAELSANKAVSQSFLEATDDEKDNKLWGLLCELQEGSRVIVFANTKRRVDNLAKTFHEFGTCAIHGDKPQREREAALAGFTNNKSPLLFATDVAARGLDIKLVTHVINYDMARDVESYVHRIGRTGRAGAVGVSVTFWNPDYDKECAPALIKIARKAGQPIPEWLARHEGTKASKLWAVNKAEKEAEALLAES